MKILCKLGVMLSCGLLICSCASMQPRLQEIQIPPERIYQKGYSLVPLDEKGWLILARKSYQLALGKRSENIDETCAIQATLINLPPITGIQELTRLVKDGQEKNTDPLRFKVMKHEITPEQIKTADCARSYAISEDTAAVKRSGRTDNMLLEMSTLTCPHPKNKAVGVNVIYSHRYYPGQNDSKFIEKATSVLNSLEFDDL